MPRSNEVGLIIGCSRSRGHAIRAQHKVVYLTMLDGGCAVQGAAVIHKLDAVGTARLETVTATLSVGHTVVGQCPKLCYIQRPADVKQTIVIKHIVELVRPAQRVGSTQSRSQLTACDTQRCAADAAAQFAGSQFDATRRSGHFRISGHRQCTTCLRNRHSSIIPVIDGFLVNGRSCSTILPSQQVFAPGDAAACGGVAVAAQQQVDAAVLHCCSTCNIKHAAVENLHGMRLSFQEAAGAAVVVHINAGGICADQMQQRSIETAAHANGAADIQNRTKSIINTGHCTARDGSRAQRAVLQSQVCVGQGAIQHTAIQHHGSTRSGNVLAHRIHSQRTLLHGDACERIACIGYDVAHAGTVVLAIEQVIRVINHTTISGLAILTQHQGLSGILVRKGHAAINRGAGTARQLNRHLRRLREAALAAVAVHIHESRRSFLNQRKGISLDIATKHQCTVVRNHGIECKVADTFQRVAAGESSRNTATRGLDIHPAHAAAGANRTAGLQHNDTIGRFQQSRCIGIHRQRTTLHLDACQLRACGIHDALHICHSGVGQQVFIMVNHTTAGGAAIAAQHQGVCCGIVADFSARIHRGTAVDNLHPFERILRKTAGTAVAIHVHTGGSFCVQCPRGMNLTADTQRATVADSPTE